MPVAILWVGKEIIDAVIALSQSDTSDYTKLWWLVGIELVLAVGSDLLGRAATLSTTLVGSLYANESSVEIIKKTGQMELSDLEDSEFYDKLERARRQTSNRISLLSDLLSQAQSLITIASLIVGLIVFEPLLVLLLILAIIPSLINELKFTKESYGLAFRWSPERRELDYLRYVGASDVTAKEIKLFGLSDYISDRFKMLSDKYYLETRSLAIRRSAWGSLFNVLGSLAYYGAYVFILLRVLAGILTVGELTFLAGSFNRLRNSLQQIFARFSKITESSMYLKDYFDFMDLKVQEIEDGKRGLPLPKSLHNGFTFDRVSFRYPGAEKDVLTDLSFHLKSTEKLALVGENGAGKTTLIKLLLRFYEPTSGRIFLDGIDIKEYDKATYQQFFGVIFQDFFKYNFSARDNIAVGQISQKEKLELIKSAASQSLANEVIEEFSNGYDQQLGKRFKDGVDLSGGQWQKVALARAYMKDAEVVILDEPTSALDARAEYEAFQRFIGLTQNKTAVIISHRFSTVRMADRILVLKDGKCHEIGSHEELLANEGLYAELFSLQAAGYQ
ncbi:MAG: ABC transporter ATP-binding protein [Saprospiraceae bacterium]|nr:ABC transporter ATP-binding protein [Saprospiraceae bacterium]